MYKDAIQFELTFQFFIQGEKKPKHLISVFFLSRCATGYHGNPQVPGGRCEECKCSSWGSLPGPCDPVTGQCRCRVGASGRSCDQCMERHVCGAAGIICKTNLTLSIFISTLSMAICCCILPIKVLFTDYLKLKQLSGLDFTKVVV